VHGLHAATSKVVNSAQGSSCKLKFVHELPLFTLNTQAKAYNFTALITSVK
jgi:hypothetical protein